MLILGCHKIDSILRKSIIASTELEGACDSTVIMGDSHAQFGIDEKAMQNALIWRVNQNHLNALITSSEGSSPVMQVYNE